MFPTDFFIFQALLEGVPKVFVSAWYEMILADIGGLPAWLGSVRVPACLIFFRRLAPIACWIWWPRMFPTPLSTIFFRAGLQVDAVAL
jgi:hypothetical protein